MRAAVGLQHLTRTDTYDLPLPMHSDLKATRAAEPPLRRSVLNGYERFALHNFYTPQQRLCVFMSQREFRRRGWRVRGDTVYANVSARPRVLVRATVCRHCMSRACSPGSGCPPAFDPDPCWRHVCATCDVAREAHDKHGDHVFHPLSVATGDPVGYGAYEPVAHGGKSTMSVAEAG